MEENIRKSNIELGNYSYQYSFSMMLQTLYKREILQNVSYDEIKGYILLRNKLVHTNLSITKTQATNIITFVKKIASEIADYINQNK